MTAQFNNRRVLVTGASTGLGQNVSAAFAAKGAHVMLAARGEEALHAAAEGIERDGGRASWTKVDISEPASVARLIERTIDVLGGLDIAVNNAGLSIPASKVAEIDEHLWSRTLNVNLTGAFNCMRAEIGYLRDHGGGTIVNISSTIGTHRRVAGLGAYAASKAALTALSRTAALDHIAENIRINVVSPGPIDTPASRRPGESRHERDQRLQRQLPIGRVGQLSEATAAVLYLASDDAAFHVGTDLVVDGGSTA